MSAQRLYLVCSAHKLADHGFCIAERLPREHGDARGPGFEPGNWRKLQDWFDRHAACGTGPDHYQLGHAYPMNYDHPMPAPPVANSVRLALVDNATKKLQEPTNDG